MQVTVELNKWDLIAFNLYIFPKMKSTYKGMLFIGLLVCALIVITKGFPETYREWAIMAIASIAGGIGGMIIGLIFSLGTIVFSSSKGSGVLGKHEYSVTSEGLHEKTDMNEGLTHWEGILSIQTAGPYLLLQISDYLFHIIPKRSFESKRAYNDFLAFSRQHWQKQWMSMQKK